MATAVLKPNLTASSAVAATQMSRAMPQTSTVLISKSFNVFAKPVLNKNLHKKVKQKLLNDPIVVQEGAVALHRSLFALVNNDRAGHHGQILVKSKTRCSDDTMRRIENREQQYSLNIRSITNLLRFATLKLYAVEHFELRGIKWGENLSIGILSRCEERNMVFRVSITGVDHQRNLLMFLKESIDMFQSIISVLTSCSSLSSSSTSIIKLITDRARLPSMKSFW